MWELDYYSIIHTAERRGRAEGFEAGLEKGLEKGKAEGFGEGLEEGQSMMLAKHVKAMKAKGMSVAEIADITGLQAEEVEKMQ